MTSLRTLLACLAVPLVGLQVTNGSAQPTPAAESAPKTEMETITFSRIVVRFPDTPEISISGEDLRVRVLEELRRLGYPALGAESLVFGKDETDRARMVLGGTATELECKPGRAGARTCQLGVVWELLDRASDRIVYRLLTRAVREGNDPERLGQDLFWANLHSMLSRPRFHKAVEKLPAPGPTSKTLGTFARCEAGDRSMPEATQQVLAATVVVQSGNRIGTGVVVSPDGFVLTAAHVIDPSARTEVQFQRGQPSLAHVVRLDASHDVALMRLASRNPVDCLSLPSQEISVGDDVFAVGSPLGKALSYSLTRGIVSGKRRIEGVDHLQTDASINRGNSGGPLVDRTGRLAGIVTWKLAGDSVEGIAFGVPVEAVMRTLGIAPGERTSEELLAEHAREERQDPMVDDAPDPSWPEVRDAAEDDSAPAKPVVPGPQIGLRAGYGLPGGSTQQNRGVGLKLSELAPGQLAFWVDGGYRISSWVFVGGYFHYGFVQGDCESCSTINLRGGVQAQVHFRPGSGFDPWAGVGFGYEQLRSTDDMGPESKAVKWTYSGFEWLNLQAGGDVMAVEGLAWGPFLSFSTGTFRHLESRGPLIDVDDEVGESALHHWIVLGLRGNWVL